MARGITGSFYPNPRDSSLELSVTNEAFARAKNPYTFFSEAYKAWYVKDISRVKSQAA